MEELKKWLNESEDNKFFDVYDEGGMYYQICNFYISKDIGTSKKICEQINQLLKEFIEGKLRRLKYEKVTKPLGSLDDLDKHTQD